ncbi:MAG TPA: DUF3299 domain-containing protein [Tepidisphaeraceae bacterium]|jgi:hypothetical protein|nr:DUF3299 domain-containing protein [Tepidisphaeraceae bacterium]
MDGATTTTSPSSEAKIPLRERINLRILIFAAVVLFLIGTPVYIFLKENLTGGIEQVGDAVKVDLKAMGNFPFDDVNGTVNDIPERYRNLDGKNLILEGEVFAPDEAGDRMTQFQLVYSIAKCCFGGPPKVQERVFVEVPGNMKVPNLSYAFARVSGKLKIDLRKEEGKSTTVYILKMDKIEPM